MKKILALTLGALFIASNCFATLVTYTTISSDAGVTTQALNDRYSELKTVINGNLNSENIQDASIASSDIAISANPLKRDGENIGEYVYSGGTIATSASLSSTITAMVAYIKNDADGYLHRVATAATNKTFTASKDTYVYCDYAGAFIYQEVANGAGQPSDPANSIILAKVVTDGTTVAAVTDKRQTTPTNLRIYSYYKNGLVLSRDIATATTVNIGPGDIELGTTGGKRTNNSPINVTFASAGIGGLDTGSLAANTYYYIFAVADDTNAVNFKGIASTSSTDAATVTNERLVGWCYANAANSISSDSVGAFRKFGGDAPNICRRIGKTDVTYTGAVDLADIPDMSLKFISSGRPTEIKFSAPMLCDTAGYVALSMDSSSLDNTTSAVTGGSAISQGGISVYWTGTPSIGTHEVKVRWAPFNPAQVIYQSGASIGSRILSVEEK